MGIQPSPIAGFLNVDKPTGWTSSDVVAKLRSAFQLRRQGIKIGHGGTLDPLATGVLPICVGYATRLSEFVLSGDKTYLMTGCLGTSTDTYDSEGRITEQNAYDTIRLEDLKLCLAEFRGEIDQIPPMFSAIKRDGQPLYKLARQGKKVARNPRRVNVESVMLTAWEPPHFSIRIECGSGFYARSLAHDIGQNLGCGAYMTSLRRERAGEFQIEDAVSIETLIAEVEGDLWARHLLKPDHVLKRFNAIVLDSNSTEAFLHGRKVHIDRPTSEIGIALVRVYASSGDLLGLASNELDSGMIRPSKVFNP